MLLQRSARLMAAALLALIALAASINGGSATSLRTEIVEELAASDTVLSHAAVEQLAGKLKCNTVFEELGQGPCLPSGDEEPTSKKLKSENACRLLCTVRKNHGGSDCSAISYDEETQMCFLFTGQVTASKAASSAASTCVLASCKDVGSKPPSGCKYNFLELGEGKCGKWKENKKKSVNVRPAKAVSCAYGKECLVEECEQECNSQESCTGFELEITGTRLIEYDMAFPAGTCRIYTKAIDDIVQSSDYRLCYRKVGSCLDTVE
ncbi:Hypothetical Protein FCC1311_036542 [Hondaea fermentalgiana]|uniref:Apple domain-containing protein n=1 Tax=Hondaea fermentalgiana TaxID=2315210 RepID=A0A2R5GFM2_9STRA|nr:Hypothetical Protein FCC1311_036542 [Hondaea fermentalgiana]|eukprot:GBG27433.1 Hypothetical Protein FCC1311_036542 [Hondaea fermentalgiana]